MPKAYKPIRSVLGKTERHRCRRCWRIRHASNFIPVPNIRTRPRYPGEVALLLHPYCTECRGQLKGRWADHPQYTPKADRFFEKLVAATKANAHTRGIPFSLEKDDAIALWIEQEGKCSLSGIEMMLESGNGTRNDMRASIDRVDSSLGYMFGNVHLVCAIANIMKNDMSYSRFVGMCERIVRHQAEKVDELEQALTV